MSDLLSLLSQESLKVADLERIYHSGISSERFVRDVTRAMRLMDADLAWRAVWLLKRHAEAGKVSEAELVQLAGYADELPHWASRLNLCQLFATTGCPTDAREVLYPYLVECFANRRPMIRAWAISVLWEFKATAVYRKRVTAMIRDARADPAASMIARLRHLAA